MHLSSQRTINKESFISIYRKAVNNLQTSTWRSLDSSLEDILPWDTVVFLSYAHSTVLKDEKQRNTTPVA